jgi:hypothetical protein
MRELMREEFGSSACAVPRVATFEHLLRCAHAQRGSNTTLAACMLYMLLVNHRVTTKRNCACALASVQVGPLGPSRSDTGEPAQAWQWAHELACTGSGLGRITLCITAQPRTTLAPAFRSLSRYCPSPTTCCRSGCNRLGLVQDDEEPEQQHVANNSLEDCAAKLAPLLERLTAYVTPSDAFAAEVRTTIMRRVRVFVCVHIWWCSLINMRNTTACLTPDVWCSAAG